LAQRISSINAASAICDAVSAKTSEVREIISRDHRIGKEHLMPSFGFGGSCFAKDIRALISICE